MSFRQFFHVRYPIHIAECQQLEGVSCHQIYLTCPKPNQICSKDVTLHTIKILLYYRLAYDFFVEFSTVCMKLKSFSRVNYLPDNHENYHNHGQVVYRVVAEEAQVLVPRNMILQVLIHKHFS